MSDKPQFTINQADSPADIAVIGSMFTAYTQWLDMDLTFQGLANELANLPGVYSQPKGALLLARSHETGEPLGCIALRELRLQPEFQSARRVTDRTSKDEKGHEQASKFCEVKRLYTLPAARGKGVARALIREALDVARSEDYDEAFLDTLPRMTAAVALYRSEGFTDTAKYYDSPVQEALYMSKNLHYSIHDPPLTDLGVEQCAGLRKSLEERFGSETGDMAVVASPMRRTLQTTHLGLSWLIERGVKIEADPDWQENSAKPCDTGSPIPVVEAEYPEVDYSKVDPVWPDKTSPAGRPYAYTRAAILERGQRGLAKLQDRPEKFIFVVSHSGFLRLGVTGWWFFNSDYRIFQFTSETAGVAIEQDKSTLKGGLGLSWETRVELGFELPEEDPVEDAAAAS